MKGDDSHRSCYVAGRTVFDYKAESQLGINQKPLSKQERCALREVMCNPETSAWRDTLDGMNRRKLNHPNKVIERWRRATQTSDTE